MTWLALLLAVYTVKDISARNLFVLSFDLFLVLVFPVCINSNLLFSFVFLVQRIYLDTSVHMLISLLVIPPV